MLASDPEGGALNALRFSLASDIVELVVLTSDEAFLQILREAVGGARRLWHVPSADKVSDLLVAGEVGILVLDVQALIEAPTVFVAQIKRQFPDLVVVVAGNRDAESSLAGLISNGIVYRFIHKPMSPGRAKLFADAAVKKFEEQRRRTASTPSVRRKPRSNRGALIGGTVGVLGAIIVATWAIQKGSDPGAPRAAAVAHPPAAESLQLQGAAAALAANRLTEPAGDNALELYLQAQAQDPADPRARAGLAEVHERLLARAENALLEERLDEAAVAIETARRSGVESGRIAFLSAQLAKSRERVRTAQAAARAHGLQSLASRRISDAPQVDPARDSALDAAQTPPPAARRPADADGGAELLKNADERMQQDRLIEPADESTATRHDVDLAADRQQFMANVVPAGELTLIKSVRPDYPKKARASRIEGWVELNFTVDENGAVKDIVVHAASVPVVFDGAAIGALAQWRYKPVVRDSKTVPQRARLRIRFTLAG